MLETQPLAVTDGLDARSKAVPVRLSIPIDELSARTLRLSGQRSRAEWPQGRLLAGTHRGCTVGSGLWALGSRLWALGSLGLWALWGSGLSGALGFTL